VVLLHQAKKNSLKLELLFMYRSLSLSLSPGGLNWI